jgi:hypothetical protein
MASGNVNNDGFDSKKDNEDLPAREAYRTAKDHNSVPRCQSPTGHLTKIKDYNMSIAMSKVNLF